MTQRGGGGTWLCQKLAGCTTSLLPPHPKNTHAKTAKARSCLQSSWQLDAGQNFNAHVRDCRKSLDETSPLSKHREPALETSQARWYVDRPSNFFPVVRPIPNIHLPAAQLRKCRGMDATHQATITKKEILLPPVQACRSLAVSVA